MSGLVLHEELLAEILSRLPAKDLMRFRCVSKSFNSLVFDPMFVKLHLQRSSKNTHMLISFSEFVFDGGDDYNYEGGYISFAAPISIRGLLENPLLFADDGHRLNLDDDDDASVLGVCNGLVCLLHRRDDFKEFWFRFWNPATKIASGDSPRIRMRDRDRIENNFYRFGFGYDDSSDTYKVVVIISDGILLEVRVHCLGDTCWRNTNTLTCPSLPIQDLHGTSMSGTVNWLAIPCLNSSNQRIFAINELVIFSYDLKNETYRYLPMPNSLSKVTPYNPNLIVLKGCLCLSYVDQRNHFGVWLMSEFGVENSWTQLLNVSYDHLYDPTDYYYTILPEILCLSENDVVLLANHETEDFILYSTRDNRIEPRGFLPENKYLLFSHDYVQSLVLPYQN